jgi:glycosyltransferase involved in cell wall biosynthesis
MRSKEVLKLLKVTRATLTSYIKSGKITGTKLAGTFVDDSYNIERRRTFKGIGLLKYQYTWLLDRVTSFIPDIWISNSQCIGDNNAKKLGLSSSKIKVVYRGRNSDDFKAWQNPVTPNFKFVCIGRLYEKKGYPELIEAFSILNKKHSNAQLIIYGEGSYRAEMEKRIAALNLKDKRI